MRKKRIILGLITTAVFVGFFLIQHEVAAVNDIQKARINLGRHLFYDTKLSYNKTKSCVSCHDPSLAFTDGYRTSAGADGYNLQHNAISLLNVRYRSVLTWANPSVLHLKMQLNFPFFNEHPKELGWTGNESTILKRFQTDSIYQLLFKQAFLQQRNPFNITNIQTALVAFEEQLVSYGAAYDQYLMGNKKALTEDALQGLTLFNSTKFSCNTCHLWEKPYKKTQMLFYKGIRVPTLRNVMLTAPYMHEGRVEDIAAIFTHYEQTQQFQFTKLEKQQMIAFLYALTDTSYLRNKELLNPFQYQ
jgi:cytochrome c peroxidase